MRISDWSSDVCSSDLLAWALSRALLRRLQVLTGGIHKLAAGDYTTRIANKTDDELGRLAQDLNRLANVLERTRSEEHTSELQSLMRISYAVFCLKKQTKHIT